MQIRFAEEKDIPAIVALLRLSLGESLMPKSEAFWRWKHVDNPFGKSPVLLAFENDQLVGVRAMMLWNWIYQGETVKAARAVDTATHPDYHGKGIFRKLTLSMLEECRSQGVSFIFNTPNQSSRPGYLKMGWQVAGRLPVNFKVVRPFGMAASLLGLSASRGTGPVNWIPPGSDGWMHDLIGQYTQNRSDQFHTLISNQYLKWRYVDVPVASYFNVVHVAESQNALVIGRIKDSKFGREMRITEWISAGNDRSKVSGNLISDTAKSLNADFITSGKVTKAPGFWLTLPGPTVTILDLRKNQIFNELIGFRKWAPTLGDLELF